MSDDRKAAFKRRLERFYGVYNPACIPSVDAIMLTYKDREEELLRVLVNKYGPEPPADPSSTVAPTATVDGLEPHGRSATANSLSLQSNDGRQQLQQQQQQQPTPVAGAQPSPRFVSELQQRLQRMITRYDPPQCRGFEVTAASVADAASLLEVLVATHGPEPPADTRTGGVDWRLLITTLMEERCPSDAHKAAVLMDTFKGREKEVYDALLRRYPTIPTTAAAAGASTVGKRHSTLTPAERAALRGRLERYYAHYKPDKVSVIDNILDAFRGAPEELMSQIVAKYGPEPVDDAADDAQVMALLGISSSTPTDVMASVDSNIAARQRSLRPAADAMGNDDEASAAQSTNNVTPFRRIPNKKIHDSDDSAPVTADQPPNPQPLLSSAPQAPPALLRSSSSPAASVRPSAQQQQQQQQGAQPPSYEAMIDSLARVVVGADSEPHITRATVHHGDDWKSRIYNMYSFYRPGKLLHIGEKCANHAGAEAQWLSLLLTKYGPEPPPRRSGHDMNSDANVAFEGQLRALFERHDTSMLDFVPLLVHDPSIARSEFIRDAQTKYASMRGSGASRRVSPRLEDHVVHVAPSSQFRSPRDDDYEEDEARHHPNRRHPQHAGDGAGHLSGRADHPPLRRRELIDLEGPSTVAELELAVQDLAVALDAKTNELETLVGRLQQATDDRGMLEGKVNELAARASEADIENGRLREIVRWHTAQADEIAALKSSIQVLTSHLEQEKARSSQANSTVALREHQNRILRMQMQQLSDELQARDDKIKAVLQDQRAMGESLAERLKDIAALQLDLTPTSDPDKFYSVAEDIQKAFQAHYAERIEADEAEMREYYEYAEKQIGNREAIIEELLSVLAGMMSKSAVVHGVASSELLEQMMAPKSNGAASRTGDEPADGGGDSASPPSQQRNTIAKSKGSRAASPVHEALADELARLRIQVKTQEAEHSALLHAMSMRHNAAQVQPPVVRLAAERWTEDQTAGSGVASRAARSSSNAPADSIMMNSRGGVALTVAEENRAVLEMKRRMAEQDANMRAQQVALTAELQRHMSDMAQLHERLAMVEHERALEAQRAKGLEEELRALKQQGGTTVPAAAAATASSAIVDAAAILAGSAAVNRAASPASQAEIRASNALAMSEKLLEAAGRRVGSSRDAQEPPPPSTSVTVGGGGGGGGNALLAPPSRALEQYFAAARESMPYSARDASSNAIAAGAAPWHAAAHGSAAVPLPQAKTVWGLMYGPDSSSSA